MCVYARLGLTVTDKAHQRCKVTSNHRMLLCVACRNGDVPAKLCMKSLEKEGVSVLHENLRLKRKERGLSQEELASRLHVVRQTISKWEKGMSVPDSEQIIIVGVRNRMSKRGSLYLRHAI